MTPALIQTLCEHAAGNLRLLMNMAREPLAAASRERQQIDEQLCFEVFALDSNPPNDHEHSARATMVRGKASLLLCAARSPHPRRHGQVSLFCEELFLLSFDS
jgi:hypothetical protein